MHADNHSPLPRSSSQTSLRSVGQFQANLTAHQYFPGILCRVVNREEEGRTPLPQGSYRTIQRLCCGCRGVSVTVRSQNLSLTRESVHRTKPQEKKKTLDFILLFMNLFFIYHHLPNLRMKSWFLPFSFRK